MMDQPSGMRRGLANYGDAGLSLFLRKAFLKAMGYSDDALNRTIVGITNTFSGCNACHKNVPDMIDAIKPGVMLAGGLPIEFPVVSATAALLTHTGRPVVFTSLEDLAARVDDPALDVTANDVLVLQTAGSKGAPGMSKSGYLLIPKKLAGQGVKDRVRISDARMSGTAFGTMVLHTGPEVAVGGPIGLARDGDLIRLDGPNGRLEPLVDEAELARRRHSWVAPSVLGSERGTLAQYLEQVTQAEDGCDFRFLTKAGTGGPVLTGGAAE